METVLIAPSFGLPVSSLIESVDNRDQLRSFTFECVSGTGTKFTTEMNGFNREHAYRRLRIQTDGSIMIAA